MKAFRYIFLTICALAEASLFAFGITGFIAYRGDPDPDVPIMVVAAVTVCAMVLLGITIKSFINVAKDREAPVIYGFLLKFPVMIFALGIMWFALDIPEAGWLAVILSVPLAALFICLPRLRENSKKAQPVRTAQLLPQFTRDKAEWAWDDAAEEYLRLTGGATGQAFSDEENEKIYGYAGTPTAYFLGWLIQKDLVSDEFRRTYDHETIRAVRDGRMTPVEFYAGYMDYVLVRDDIAPEILKFVDLYFRDGTRDMALNHGMRRYFFDYYKAVCSSFDIPRYYCVDFNWDSFRRLSEILDRRLNEFNRVTFDEDELEDYGQKLRSQYFDTEAELFAEPGTPRAYAGKCAAAYGAMSPGLRSEIAEHLIEYCVADLPEEPTAEWVIRHFSPYKVVVFRPDSSNEAAYAYVVLGESEWEPEHGISFTVIGDHVVAFGGYGDAEPPYEEDLQWRYRILEDAARGNYCAAEVIPARFGGRPDSADNQVVVPKAAAERKRQYEDLIEALFVLKLAEHYDCKITYQEGKPNYLFLETTAGSRRTFADLIGLGF